MNIEEIKKRVEATVKKNLTHDDGDVRDSQGNWVAEFKHDADGELFVNARNDIIYLLSIIDRMETTLIQCRAYNNHPKYDGLRITEIVNEALQVIRGN